MKVEKETPIVHQSLHLEHMNITQTTHSAKNLLCEKNSWPSLQKGILLYS